MVLWHPLKPLQLRPDANQPTPSPSSYELRLLLHQPRLSQPLTHCCRNPAMAIQHACFHSGCCTLTDCSAFYPATEPLHQPRVRLPPSLTAAAAAATPGTNCRIADRIRPAAVDCGCIKAAVCVSCCLTAAARAAAQGRSCHHTPRASLSDPPASGTSLWACTGLCR